MSHGGKRVGAGRPKGASTEASKVIRVPCSKVELVKEFIQKNTLKTIRLPLYGSKVQAGFPSPADDFIEQHLDLNEYLIPHPAATFLVRAKGQSMINAGIFSGDILVVDKSLEPSHGKIVIAALDGELTVKRLYQKDGVVKLQPENPEFPDIIINTELETVIWGVVTNVIHEV
jgi:DNA polymerase V